VLIEQENEILRRATAYFARDVLHNCPLDHRQPQSGEPAVHPAEAVQRAQHQGAPAAGPGRRCM